MGSLIMAMLIVDEAAVEDETPGRGEGTVLEKVFIDAEARKAPTRREWSSCYRDRRNAPEEGD